MTDNTQSKSRSAASLHSPDQLKLFFSQAPFSIAIVTGEDYRFAVVNQRYLDLINKKEDEIIGHAAFEVLPELKLSLEPLLDEVMRSGEPYQGIEFPMPIPDAEKVQYFNFVYEPVKDANGKVAGVFVSGFNVSEQVAAKLKLEQNENQLRFFADAMPVLISYIDRNERYKLTNKRYEEWFGEPAHRMEGVTMLEMLGEKAYHAVHPYVKRALAGERVTYESKVHYIRKGETYIHATYIPDVGFNGEVKGFYALVEDVTERKRVENKIKESESQFRRMTDTVPAIIWITDANGYCNYLNKYWYDTTGQLEAEALGFGWLEATHPEDKQSAEKAFIEANTAQKEFSATYRLRHANGQYRWVIDRGSPRFDALGKYEGMTGSVVEIQQQKEAEEKIRESEVKYRLLAEQLEKLVDERTRELQRSNEDLQQFAHVASHDLKEPVRKVKIFIDQLLLNYRDEVPAKALEYLKKIDRSCDRMNMMVEGVLQYSTLNSSESVLQQVDTASLFESIESDLEVVIAKKSARIIKANLPTLNGSPILLYQLFYNLVNNSLKFSATDRSPIITISVRMASSTEAQDARLNLATGYYYFTITDNGIGFQKNEEERIFSTFTRLNAKDEFEGTGLGLSLCRNIVERHGGAIWARGEKNKGATFSVLLPA